VGTSTVNCDYNNQNQPQQVEGGTIICPDFRNFCSEYASRCNNDCNAHGLCIGGGYCMCYTGWAGGDCSTAMQVDYARITAGGFALGHILSLCIAAVLGILSAGMI